MSSFSLDAPFPANDTELLALMEALLPRAQGPLALADLQQVWGSSAEGALHQADALISAGVLSIGEHGYEVPGPLRETLLIAMINQGRCSEARDVLLSWRVSATVQGDLPLLVLIHSHLANILLLEGRDEGFLAEYTCALALCQACGDQEGVARLSWGMGAYLAQQGRRERAIPLLARAAALAEELGLEQAPRYRQRLREVQDLA